MPLAMSGEFDTQVLLRLSKDPDADQGKCRERCLFRQESVAR